MAWVLFLAGLLLLVALHLAVMAVASRWAKLEPTTIAFGFGPALLTRPIAGMELRVGAIPFGGSVSMGREDAGLGARLIPIVVAGAGLLVLGVLLVGFDDGARVARDAAVLPFSGALSPSGAAQDALRRFVDAVSNGSALATLGGSAIVLGVWNLAMGTTMAASTLHRALALLVPLVTLLLLVPWAYAWFVFLT